jgi:uncharacterized protein YgbK (DUF1537 family)
MQAERRPRYGWYGDDFTGASDTLATLAARGLRALLFLDIPSDARLAAAGPLDAIGIAGATRTMAPAEMAVELDAAGRFFAAQGVALMHYKCCSTFDSAPHIGSIGAAIRALRPHFANPLVPILGGQPNLGRYCLFGTLFAAAGIGGTVHRIDRHPTMGVHPVTPMGEADLRRHLAAQGLERIALVDYRSYENGGTDAALAAALDSDPDAVLFDVSRTSDLAVISQALAQRAPAAPMLVVGASAIAQMMSLPPQQSASITPAAVTKPAGPVLALVGSLSPVTRAQVEAASGYVRIAIDPNRLQTGGGYSATLAQEARIALGEGNVMLVTDRPAGAPSNTGAVAAATAALLQAILTETEVSRLVVAGGDTSTLAIKALDIWGLSYREPLVTGAPLCRAHSADARLDGLDIVLKGGQMGPPDFFAIARGA